MSGMPRDLLLAIDIGSSSCKAGLFREDGRCEASARGIAGARSSESGTGTREYDPKAWLSAASRAVRKLSDQAGDLHGRIACLGLSGQIGTHLVVDGSGEPAMPAISWQDGRAKTQAAKLAREYPGFALDGFIGMHLPPGTAWPLPRLLWMKEHAPELLRAGYKWIQPKDFLLHFLTGELKTDWLSLRGLMHPVRREMHDEVRSRILGIDSPEDMLPAAMEPFEVAGVLRRGAAERLGLDSGIPVVAGAGDFHCAVLGSGARRAGDGFNVTGTSDHVGVLVDSSESSAKSAVLGRYPSLVDGLDILYGATSSSGGMLEWTMKVLGGRKRAESAGDFLDREIGSMDTAKGIVCLPYLNGERAPVWNADARGTFIGLGAGHGRAEILLAVMEGVAASLRHNADELAALGCLPDSLRVSGASAASTRWNRIKASMLKRDIKTLACNETSCLGAAMLASVGAGFRATTADAATKMSATIDLVKPDPEKYPYYDAVYGCYRDTYEANRAIFGRLAGVRAS